MFFTTSIILPKESCTVEIQSCGTTISPLVKLFISSIPQLYTPSIDEFRLLSNTFDSDIIAEINTASKEPIITTTNIKEIVAEAFLFILHLFIKNFINGSIIVAIKNAIINGT